MGSNVCSAAAAASLIDHGRQMLLKLLMRVTTLDSVAKRVSQITSNSSVSISVSQSVKNNVLNRVNTGLRAH